MYIYIYIYIYIYVYIYIYIRTHIHTYMNIHCKYILTVQYARGCPCRSIFIQAFIAIYLQAFIAIYIQAFIADLHKFSLLKFCLLSLGPAPFPHTV